MKTATARILVVDDDQAAADGLGAQLETDGFAVEVTYAGAIGLARAQAELFDLVILDLVMPEVSGWEVCGRLKMQGFEAPILMLSSTGDEMSKVSGLEMGADDYVVKPYSYRELLARVRVLLRRHAHEPRDVGPFTVDFERRLIRRGPRDLGLSPKEFAIVALLVRRAPRVVKRDEILREVWGPDFLGDEKTVAIHVRWIRQKMEETPDAPRYLRTARGGGYLFSLP